MRAAISLCLAFLIRNVACADTGPSIDPDDPLAFNPHETGILIGAEVGNVRYALNGSLGPWKVEGSTDEVVTLRAVYRAAPYWSFEAFKDWGGDVDADVAEPSGRTIVSRRNFESRSYGASVIGTLNPFHRFRLKGAISLVRANQRLQNDSVRAVTHYEDNCALDDYGKQVCLPRTVIKYETLDSQSDEQHRTAVAGTVGIEASISMHWIATLSITRRRLGDVFFNDSIKIRNDEEYWGVGFLYGPF
jgi:hypothetical protein